jgi:hypothetical protein
VCRTLHPVVDRGHPERRRRRPGAVEVHLVQIAVVEHAAAGIRDPLRLLQQPQQQPPAAAVVDAAAVVVAVVVVVAAVAAAVAAAAVAAADVVAVADGSILLRSERQ